MRRSDQPYATILAGSRRLYFRGPSDFVDYHDLWGVILDALNHYGALLVKAGHHHSPSKADTRVGYVAIASDLIAGINNANVQTFS